MAKRNRQVTRAIDKQREQEGRGQGHGINYRPWLTIHDVPSTGRVHRKKGWKTGRDHHLLSDLELKYFYIVEWAAEVLDIREQYPLLPLEETLSLADEVGVAHPTDTSTKEPIVMTTDFMLTAQNEGHGVLQARTIKPAAKLASKRVIEKFEIERRYWAARSVDWGIVTEREIPQVLIDNLALLHDYVSLDDRVQLSEDDLHVLIETLAADIREERMSLRHITRACDKRLGFEPGTSLCVAYHLLASRRWQFNLSIPINPGKSLILYSMSSNDSDQE